MSTIRYTDGSVTVELDGALEDLVRQALDAAAGETVRVLEAAAEEVATQARADWYDPANGGVTRRTGKSGDIEVVTTVSPDEVTVSVGSTDLQKAIYVHRPGRLSTVPVEITRDDYYERKRKGGPSASTVFHAKRSDKNAGVEAGKFYRLDPSPLASDGKFLLTEMVRRPMRVKAQALGPELAAAILKQMGGA